MVDISNMKKLYSLTDTKEEAKKELYVQKNGNNLNFITYFNSFSLKKWSQYTTLKKVALNLQLVGKWKIIWKLFDEKNEQVILEDICDTAVYQQEFAIKDLSGIILGFELEPLTQDAQYLGGAWYGSFAEWQDKEIGITICTFKREQYVNRTIDVLRNFQKNHHWLTVLVVDNGSTLQTTEQDKFRIVHNPNYGGSGGFTRGMIEYVDEDKVDYVLMMDDDIVLDPTALERSYALLCGLKQEYQESFLAGAMLRLEEPTIQHENTARWGKIKLHAFGGDFDLTKTDYLIKNEINLPSKNRYGAWWYCCIPLRRIQQLGYPLPVFVKGDDMEYGIRNDREVIHMNGIGVWHKSFQAKFSPVVNYYNDRNMLIINNYAKGCGFFTFAVVVCGRVYKRLLHRDLSGLNIFYQALLDYNRGFEGITEIPADKKMQEIRKALNRKISWRIFPKLLSQALKSIVYYKKISLDYKKFRIIYLQDACFWQKYM